MREFIFKPFNVDLIIMTTVMPPTAIYTEVFQRKLLLKCLKKAIFKYFKIKITFVDKKPRGWKRLRKMKMIGASEMAT